MDKLKFIRRGLFAAMTLQVINLIYVVMAGPGLVPVAILIIVGVLTLIILWVTTNAVAEAFREAFGDDEDDGSDDEDSGDDGSTDEEDGEEDGGDDNAESET